MKNKVIKYLETFPEIKELQNDRVEVAIGGMTALALHGLIVRETDELDLIVYSRDEEVREKIAQWTANEFGSQINGEMSDGSKRRSYKMKRDDLILDFLIEEEEEIEKDLLFFKGVKIQSINIILKAKRSYGRKKDMKDFEDIVKNNYLEWKKQSDRGLLRGLQNDDIPY